MDNIIERFAIVILVIWCGIFAPVLFDVVAASERIKST